MHEPTASATAREILPPPRPGAPTLRVRVLWAAGACGLLAGLGFGYVLAHDFPMAGSPLLTFVLAFVGGPVTALAGTLLALSLTPADCFGFWRGIVATLVAWLVFCAL